MPAEITMFRATADSLLCKLCTTARCALAAAILMLWGLSAAIATQVADESAGVAAYRVIATTGSQWRLLTAGCTLKTGMHDSRVPRLRQRLGLKPAAT